MASKKLNKKILDQLVLEVLQEKMISVDLGDKFDIESWSKAEKKKLTDPHLNKDPITNLTKLDPTPTVTLDADDIQLAFVNGGEDKETAKHIVKKGTTPSIKAAAKAAFRSPPKMDAKKMGDIKDIEMAKQTYAPQSIAFGQMANIGVEQSTTLGQFPEGVGAAVKTFFDGTSTFFGRIEKISKFSKAVFSNKKTAINKMSQTELLSASLFLDYLTTMVKEMDSGTGAYQFETLLAVMAGGTVVGKGDINTDSGKSSTMGAVDFLMNDGTAGSAKYYSNVGGGKLTQSMKGFAFNQPVLYIIAHKKEDRSSFVTKGTADPRKIIGLNIYFVVVKLVVNVPPDKRKPENFEFRTHGDKSVSKMSGTTTHVNISQNIKKKKPLSIYVAAANGESLKDALSDVTEKADKNLKNAYSYFQEMFKEMYNANQKAQRYASTGDKGIGNAALTSLSTADDRFIDLAAELSVKTTGRSRNKDLKTKTADIKKQQKITETKSIKDLDKLIERVILEHINK